MLRFDFTRLGASEGEFANTTFSSNVYDLVAAADHSERRCPHPPPDRSPSRLSSARRRPSHSGGPRRCNDCRAGRPAQVIGLFGKRPPEDIGVTDEVEVILGGSHGGPPQPSGRCETA